LQHDGFFGESIAMAFKSVDSKDAELAGKIRFGHFLEPQRGGIIHAGY
jgi:hypothetical protein